MINVFTTLVPPMNDFLTQRSSVNRRDFLQLSLLAVMSKEKAMELVDWLGDQPDESSSLDDLKSEVVAANWSSVDAKEMMARPTAEEVVTFVFNLVKETIEAI